MLLKENTNNGHVLHPTELSVRRENDYVVFTFVAKRSSFYSAGNKYNDPLYDGSVVEVFIDYGKANHYYEVEVAPNGAVFLADIENINGKTLINCLDNCFVKTDVKIDGDAYTATIKIPLEKIIIHRTIRWFFIDGQILALCSSRPPLGRNADHRLLLSLATRKRVFVKVDGQLDHRLILFQLIPDVFGYFGFILANRIYVIASTPKLSVSVFKFQVAPSLINNQ